MLRISDHVKFLENIIEKKDLNYYLTEPNRMATSYWIVNSYKIMKIDNNLKIKFLSFIKSCKNSDGGYGGNIGYPSTIMNTFNALQILYIYHENFYDEKTISFLVRNQLESGAFSNDKYGLTDNRINCSAVLSLHLLYLNKKMDFTRESLGCALPYDFCKSIGFNYKACIGYLMKCYNPDGGFGFEIGDESHCAFTFCCVSALRSLGCLKYINKRDIARFISLRQAQSGGLSGRIDKKEDVCYSFWAYSVLKMLDMESSINQKKLISFILACQGKSGGMSDRPGNEPDPFHLMFSLASLSLLGTHDLSEVDPGFAL